MIVINAMIVGIYAILTLAISPIAYSQIQFRLSEIIVFLAFYNKNYIPGLTIGCVIANMFSPFGMLDIIFGTISTILVCLAMYKVNNKYLAAFIGAIITGIIIGGELWYAYDNLQDAQVNLKHICVKRGEMNNERNEDHI